MRLVWMLAFSISMSFIYSCSPAKNLHKNTTSDIGSLKFIDEYDLPQNMQLKGTAVGGLSGIDYDASRNLYYMICDDPSSKGPTRYYTATISFTEKGFDMTPLLNENGQTYADITKDRVHSADVEAMRYDAKRDELVWSSEGQRVIRDSIRDLENPAIVIMDREGHYKDSFYLPLNMHIQLEEKGPRHNEVFEGLSFDENYSHLFVSLESPIYEDGPKAAGGDSTAWIRILKFDRKTKRAVGQYAYMIDAVQYPANPPGAFKLNGVSDILYIGDNKFIVIERSYSTGRGPSDIRVYLADASNATNVAHFPSLDMFHVIRPITKKLLVNMDNLGRYIDNIEGVTFGPLLPNGHKTLLFVADDNFAAKQKSQFLLFEVLPE